MSALLTSTALKRCRLTTANSMFFLCDLQDKFRPLIYRSETIINKAAFLNKAFNILEVPCLITEHYSKALGKTVPDIELFTTTKVFEKRIFSMMGSEEVKTALADSNRKQVCVM